MKSFFLFLILLSAPYCRAQLTVTSSSTSSLLASKLAGQGITIVSDSLICNTAASGTFVSTATPIGLDSGILLSTGRASAASGVESGVTNTRFGGAGDGDLTSLLGTTSTSADACALIIHFIPGGDTVSFNYQFGSEEYRSSVCGRYNDAFAFFISGPGISTSLPGVNMALVPGTSIPVTVNSINNGTPSTGYTLANCTAMGAGSPFTAYYIDNSGGTSISYRGYTTVLTAKHWVRPCDTYRIKLAIVDAGNDQYDSGVFIEAGSLKTNAFTLVPGLIGRTINGVPNTIVKTCGPDSVYVKSNKSVASPTTIQFSYSGTATDGVDYTGYDSVTINAGDSSAAFPITGLTGGSTSATTAVVRIASFSVCGTRYSGISDSVIITILGAPVMSITNTDTILCPGQTLQLNATGTTGLTYSWTPAATLSNPAIANPIATVAGDVTYTVSATLPGSLCPTLTDTVNVKTVVPYLNIITPDTTVCEGDQFFIRVDGSDTVYYSWTPSAGLSSPTAKQPLITPTTSNNYVVTATVPQTGCSVTDNVTINVVPKFTVRTVDTFICEGNNLILFAEVLPIASTYAFNWTGPNGYTSVLQNPVITTSTQLNEGNYQLTVTNMGMCPIVANEFIDVLPTLKAEIVAPEITYCQYAPAEPLMIPGYSNVMWYESPNDSVPTLFPPYPKTDSIGIQTYYAAQISLVSNCLSEMQEVTIKVKPCCTGILQVPTAFTPNRDGKNDLLRIVKAPEYVINEFIIYNRWGVPVFEASGDNQGWDGTINGEPADMGTYYYTLTANCVNSYLKPIQLKGDVTLIR